MAFPDVAHELFGLRNHLERIVVAYRNAFRATLAFRWVDKDSENRAFTLLLLLPFVEFPRLCPLLAEERAIRFRHLTELLLPFALREHLAQDCRIRTLGDTVHASRAVFGNVLRNIRRDVAEIAQVSGAGRDK